MTAQVLAFQDMEIFHFFSKNLIWKNIGTWISQPCYEVIWGYTQGLQIWPPNMTAQIIFHRLWRFFMISWNLMFFKEHRYLKKSNGNWSSQPYGGMHSGVAVFLSKFVCSNPCRGCDVFMKKKRLIHEPSLSLPLH